MNGMGPQNKIQAMMAGLMGTGQQAGAPPTQGPSPNIPGGMQRPTDAAHVGFTKIAQGMKGLCDMLLQLGDQESCLAVEQLRIDLLKIGETRSKNMMKKLELDQKLGQAEALVGDQPAQAPQGGQY